MSSNSGAVIGGVMGGIILLLMIIVVMCIIVILCMRRSPREKGSDVVDNTAKLNTDVVMHGNPSYDVTKANTVHMEYSYDDTINPRGSDVPITTNPSYNVHTKAYSNASEDEYNYVKSSQHYSDRYLKVYPSTDQGHGIQAIHSHPTADTPKQEEYGLVNQP